MIISSNISSSSILLNLAPLSLYERVSSFYQRKIQKFVEILQENKWFKTSMVLGTLLSEPLSSIKAGFYYSLGQKKAFNFYNLNPKSLKEEQIDKRPILLIHGNYHNQSAWIDLAKKMNYLNPNPLGPIYTVNLPNGSITDKDYEIIHEKFLEIEAQYEKHSKNDVKIDLIGHSRGGALAQRIAPWIYLKNHYQKIDKIINIGNVLNQKDINDHKEFDADFASYTYEITGEYDVLVRESSLLSSDHQRKIPSGHLGLLYSDQVHQQIIDWLS